MDINTNYQGSFTAVSINPRNIKKKTISKANEIINAGVEQILRIRNTRKCDTVEMLNNRHDQVTEAMNQRRDLIRKQPWWVIKWNDLRKINKEERKIKSNINKSRAKSYQERDKQVINIEEVVNKVEEQTRLIEERQLREKERYERNYEMDMLRGRYQHSNNGFASLAGYKTEKNVLDKYFITEILKEQKGEPADVPGSVLFFGPTGNGKSTFAKAFAKETGCNIVPLRIKTATTATRYEDFLENLHQKADKAEENFQATGKRTILFIDEFSKVAGENSPILPNLEEFLTTCSDRYHCTVFGATNHPLSIKLPMTGEKSVFPYKVSVDPPNTENKTAVLKYYLKERLPKGTDYKPITQELERVENESESRFSISQIRNEICISGFKKEMTTDEVLEKINQTEPAISKQDMEKYNREMMVLMDNKVEV